jgi:superfamily II DNA or RNA helicase
MPRTEREELLSRIEAQEARLASLDHERSEIEKRLTELKRELSSLDDLPPEIAVTIPVQAPRSSEEKVALFRALFRGRAEVFPTRWQNQRKNTSGYSPTCSNEWVREVCEKPRIKCGECPHQAFIPVSDRMVLDHLQGRHTAGVYPLLEDDRCWFLAADFDKGNWQKDVEAFREMSESIGLCPAVERSRSGNGAHVWFFFSEPVAAIDARRLGSFLITETMARRHELSMASYDRLFPNQDTLPRGGFGNLIALPLQHGPRQHGNSVFVDVEWNPFSDQWTYLASVPRIARKRVEELAQEASNRGQVIGVPMGEDPDYDEAQPWRRLRLPPRPRQRLKGPLPKRICAVIAEQLFVEKEGLPPALLNQIKRLAAFQNPAFYKKQAMRLSTALTPRVISCAEDLPQHIALPRGCRNETEALLGDLNIELVFDDKRSCGESLDLDFRGELTEIQKQAVDSIGAHDTGVFVAPPGTGKTVVGIWLAASRGTSTLILVHRTQLLEQWRTQLCLFLDLAPKEIGQIGGGKRKATGKIDVAMIQSLVRGGDVANALAACDLSKYGHVIVDECHHVPAVSFERVMKQIKAKYVTGLTATPKRRDGHDRILTFQLGPNRFCVDPRNQAAQRPFQHDLIVRETLFRPPSESESAGIQTLYGQLARDPQRNELILDDILRALEDGRSPLVLTERRDHMDFLEERLGPVARNLIALRGGMGAKQRRGALDQLASIPDTEERLVLSTGRFIGEGFDDARLDTLFLTMPISWKGTLVQYAGRLHRNHQGKTDVRIFDYVDVQVPMLARMFEKRIRGYVAMGYQRKDFEIASPGGIRNDYVIEYDQEALRLADVDPF